MIKIPIILLAVCAAATVPAFGGKPDVCADTAGVFPAIYFEDGGGLGPGALADLARIGDFLRENPGVRVVAEGHFCEEGGGLAYNMGLGKAKARAVRDYLVSLGISAERIRVTSCGKERPPNSGCAEDGRSCCGRGNRVEWR